MAVINSRSDQGMDLRKYSLQGWGEISEGASVVSDLFHNPASNLCPGPYPCGPLRGTVD